MPKNSMLHLNGNQLCVIDTETTGTDHDIHEITEICLIPLDSRLEVRKDVPIFNIFMKIEREDLIDWEALRVTKTDFFKHQQTALDKDVGGDLFDQWVEKLHLPHGKRISPLAHNWQFDAGFIREWLGNGTYSDIFDGRARDTLAISLFLNDVADRKAEQVPFAKNNLPWLAKKLDIPHDAHGALSDCIVTAKVYKRFMTGMF